MCIVFEGRDTAGKGGTIKAITERVSPRVFRVVALPAPTERETVADVRAALHPALPRRRRGRDLRPQLVQPGRHRAGHGLLHRGARRDGSSTAVPAVERAMVDSGIILLKYWLEVSPDEQTRRLESRIDDPRKVWKLSDMDLKSYSRWATTREPATTMFAGQRHGLGAVVRRATPTTRSAAGSTSSPTCSARSRTSRSTHHDVELPKRQKEPHPDQSVTVPSMREIPTPFG